RGARAGLEDVDRELVVELTVCDAVAGRRDALRLVGVEQPEVGVHARGRGLDPPEPACDVPGDWLGRDLEGLYGFRGLTTPGLAIRAESTSAHIRHRQVLTECHFPSAGGTSRFPQTPSTGPRCARTGASRREEAG